MLVIKRRIPLFAVLAVTAVVTAVGASTAAATSGQRIPYTASYSFTANSDNWSCTGFRLIAGNAIQDHFKCTITDQTFSGTFTESKPFPCGCAGWESDYDGQTATSYVIRVSTNGTVEGSAKY
jgi:hypothetical protein